MSVRIRLITAPGEIEEELHELLSEMDVSAFGKDYHKPSCYWWLATEGDLQVGFAGLHVFEEISTAFLCRVAVAVTHRGQGLQRRFIRACERQCRTLGIRHMLTYVAPDNLVSANNFIKCGYLLYRPAYEYGVPGALYFQKPMRAEP
jgi:GNAT superfamily N-acetyltransferase